MGSSPTPVINLLVLMLFFCFSLERGMFQCLHHIRIREDILPEELQPLCGAKIGLLEAGGFDMY